MAPTMEGRQARAWRGKRGSRGDGVVLEPRRSSSSSSISAGDVECHAPSNRDGQELADGRDAFAASACLLLFFVRLAAYCWLLACCAAAPAAGCCALAFGCCAAALAAGCCCCAAAA
nr:unnamed protein product [Digitaria exilis]